MQTLSTVLLRVLAIYMLVTGMTALAEFPFRIILESDKDPETYLWLFTELVMPYLFALVLWFGATSFAKHISSEHGAIEFVDDVRIVTASVFLIGLYLVVTSIPELARSIYYVYVSEYHDMRSLFSQKIAALVCYLAFGAFFMAKPRLMTRIYQRNSS